MAGLPALPLVSLRKLASLCELLVVVECCVKFGERGAEEEEEEEVAGWVGGRVGNSFTYYLGPLHTDSQVT